MFHSAGQTKLVSLIRKQQIVAACSIARVERELLPACLQRRKSQQEKVLAPHKQ
jgi:hypothetical protein